MATNTYNINGMSLRKYCQINNIKYTTIICRIHQGMTLEQALAKPMLSYELSNLPGEERREIKGYEGYYDISNKGRVRTYWKARKGGSDLYPEPVRILKGRKKKQTTVYNCHTLYKETDRKRHYKTARLVAQAFLGLRYEDEAILVCHKDDNGMNNDVDNLFLGSHKDNTRDSIRKGRCKLNGFICKK